MMFASHSRRGRKGNDGCANGSNAGACYARISERLARITRWVFCHKETPVSHNEENVGRSARYHKPAIIAIIVAFVIVGIAIVVYASVAR